MEKSPLAWFRSLINNEDVVAIKQMQHLILGRLQDSNAVLTHFNEYSEQCFAEVSNDFAGKTRLLKSMKADLDHIFLKLRGMKSRLAATYPDAFPTGAMAETMDQRPDLESELDHDSIALSELEPWMVEAGSGMLEAAALGSVDNGSRARRSRSALRRARNEREGGASGRI
uniref:KxDL domain-containing protein n=1 Tax=Oryza nivara TaxID=4536 RepID=A0A0E0GQZ0_ORYNI